MNLLKNFGGSNMSNVGMNKPTLGSKNNYFNSIQLQNAQSTAKTKNISNKGSSQPKKKGPPKQFIPNKFALSFNPPTISTHYVQPIVLQYKNPQNKKLYHHKMVLKKLQKDIDTDVALQYLKKRHRPYFEPGIIQQSQIIKLIDKLKMGLDDDSQDIDVEQDFQFDYEDDFDD